MASRITTGAVIAGLALGMSACTTQDLEKFNRDMANLNASLAGATNASGVNLAAQPRGNHKQTELVEPTDANAVTAMEQALPSIKKVLSITPCIKAHTDMRVLNPYAVPGKDMTNGAWVPIELTQYHDKNYCVSVSRIDQWTMPAMNSLKFHVVFYADDSGETSNYQFEFRRMEDASWKLAGLASF